MNIQKTMEFKLTCVKCGSSEFELKKLPLTEIENSTYLYREDIENEQIICQYCKLEDYIDNLIIKAILKKELI